MNTDDRRVLAAFLTLIGVSVYILAEVWYITAHDYWQSAGILLAVVLEVALYWYLVGRHANSKLWKILGWAWLFYVVFVHRLFWRIGCDEQVLRLVDVFLFGFALAMSYAQIRKWVNQGRKTQYEGTEPSN